MEIRYALLDSRRYPAMYLPHRLFLSSPPSRRRRRRRALPCISFAFPDDDFVAEIMRLIRRQRAVRTECYGSTVSVPFPYKIRKMESDFCAGVFFPVETRVSARNTLLS